FDTAQGERLDRPVARFLGEALDLQVVHLVIEKSRTGVAAGALALAVEYLLTTQLVRRRLPRGEPTRPQELGPRREIEHVLHLRHVRHLLARHYGEPLFHGVNRIAIEVGGAELELGEVLDRAKAPLGAR